jgi:hypothetical protein
MEMLTIVNDQLTHTKESNVSVIDSVFQLSIRYNGGTGKTTFDGDKVYIKNVAENTVHPALKSHSDRTLWLSNLYLSPWWNEKQCCTLWCNGLTVEVTGFSTLKHKELLIEHLTAKFQAAMEKRLLEVRLMEKQVLSAILALPRTTEVVN